MNVSCPECQTVFRVDPARVPGPGVRARCSVCGGIIPITAARSWTDDFATPHDAASLTAGARTGTLVGARPSSPTPVERAVIAESSPAATLPNAAPRSSTPARVPPFAPGRRPTPPAGSIAPPPSVPTPQAASVEPRSVPPGAPTNVAQPSATGAVQPPAAPPRPPSRPDSDAPRPPASPPEEASVAAERKALARPALRSGAASPGARRAAP